MAQATAATDPLYVFLVARISGPHAVPSTRSPHSRSIRSFCRAVRNRNWDGLINLYVYTWGRAMPNGTTARSEFRSARTDAASASRQVNSWNDSTASGGPS